MPWSKERRRFYPSLLEQPARFWAKVDIRSDDECWPWKGCLSTQGYGRAGKREYAHRLAYVLAHGAIPDGLEIMHSCDNRQCVNPHHLSVGTRRDNMVDAARKGRIRGGGPRKFDRDEARELLAAGASLRAVARTLGVSHSSLRKALGRSAV